MLADGTPVHVAAGWRGHDAAMSLSIYSVPMCPRRVDVGTLPAHREIRWHALAH
jgi:hypothetical protein